MPKYTIPNVMIMKTLLTTFVLLGLTLLVA